jgi:hypothetical protein
LKDILFTDEANKAIEDRCSKFKEELKLLASKEALKQRGEPIEVTKCDVLRVCNNSKYNDEYMLPKTNLVIRIYFFMGVLLSFIGLGYPFIKDFLYKANSDTIRGVLITSLGLVTITISYITREFINFRHRKFEIERYKYEEISIRDDINNIESTDTSDIDNEDDEYNYLEDNNYIKLIAKVNPKIVVMQSWLEIEKAIHNILYRNMVQYNDRNKLNLRRCLEILYENNYIDKETLNKLDKMRMLRNKIAHSSEELEVSYEEAKEYNLLSIKVINKLYKLNPLKKVYIISDVNNYSHIDLIKSWNFEGNSFMQIVDSNKCSNHNEYINSLINEQIKKCDIVLLIIGEDTLKSEWVNHEIEVAKINNKEVIAVNVSNNELDISIENCRIIDKLTKENLMREIYSNDRV